jgi:hypothetical protein
MNFNRSWSALTLVLMALAGACSSNDDSASTPVPQALTINGAEVSLSAQSDWGAGYCTNVSIKNNGTSTITAWSVSIALGGSTFSSAWSATTLVANGTLVATPAGYNATLAPGQSLGFGFCGTSTDANQRPTLLSATVTGGTTGTGGSSSGGSTALGGTSAKGGSTAAGGTSVVGGSTALGGTSAKGGSTAAGGTSVVGGSTAAGGTSAKGGSTALGGSSTGGTNTGGSSSGGAGTCESGSSNTTWATSCPTTQVSCTTGTWIAGGPDPDHTGFALKGESTHFAVYSDENLSASTVSAATSYLENTVWPTYFGSPIYFKEPLCNQSTKYKASIHVHSDWGLTGGAWSSSRMGMWIGTGGLSDHWGLAHEFMHAVQSVSGGQSCNQSNTCGWIYESHANFMPHQLAEYRGDVHCSELLVNAPHLYLGSTRDRYCNWQFMEYLKDKYCYSAVNAIWTGGPAVDPFTAIRNAMGWSVSQLNDFMGEWAMHNVTWDYQNPPPTTGGNQGATYRSKYGTIADTSQTARRLRLTKAEPLDSNFAQNRRFISPHAWAPQRYGYNVIRLYPEAGATNVTLTFRGVTSAPSSPDWRWGLVATNSAMTTARYSTLQKGSDGTLNFCINSSEPLFLVVVGTPSSWYNIVWDQAYNTVPRYPYLFQVNGAWPEGFQNGKLDGCPSGLTRATNGGGCAPSGTTAYVGPYATVLAGATVSGSARIEDHATVVRGNVSGGTVGGLTLVGNGSTAFNISSGTAKTTFYPLGFFASGQSLAGGSLSGDVELQGANVSRTSGNCSGFVDGSTCTSPGTDVTPAPPYAWR